MSGIEITYQEISCPACGQRLVARVENGTVRGQCAVTGKVVVLKV